MRMALAVLVALAAGNGGASAAQDPDALANVPRITIAELKTLIASGDVVIVDVRNVDGYAAGHLPGALSIPLDTVEARAAELAAKKKTVVTYCS